MNHCISPPGQGRRCSTLAARAGHHSGGAPLATARRNDPRQSRPMQAPGLQCPRQRPSHQPLRRMQPARIGPGVMDWSAIAGKKLMSEDVQWGEKANLQARAAELVRKDVSIVLDEGVADCRPRPAGAVTRRPSLIAPLCRTGGRGAAPPCVVRNPRWPARNRQAFQYPANIRHTAPREPACRASACAA
jgi:hypothetical protein